MAHLMARCFHAQFALDYGRDCLSQRVRRRPLKRRAFEGLAEPCPDVGGLKPGALRRREDGLVRARQTPLAQDTTPPRTQHPDHEGRKEQREVGLVLFKPGSASIESTSRESFLRRGERYMGRPSRGSIRVPQTKTYGSSASRWRSHHRTARISPMRQPVPSAEVDELGEVLVLHPTLGVLPGRLQDVQASATSVRASHRGRGVALARRFGFATAVMGLPWMASSLTARSNIWLRMVRACLVDSPFASKPLSHDSRAARVHSVNLRSGIPPARLTTFHSPPTRVFLSPRMVVRTVTSI